MILDPRLRDDKLWTGFLLGRRNLYLPLFDKNALHIFRHPNKPLSLIGMIDGGVTVLLCDQMEFSSHS